EDVLARERIVAGELKVMEGAFAVGEERIAADADEQPTFTSLNRLRHGVEADRHALDENLANRLGLAGLASCPVIDGSGLGAAVRFGEHERERSIGLRIPVIVDVDAIDAVWVEVGARHEWVHVENQNRLA